MMPILRHKHLQEFTVVPNSLLRDQKLSLRDIGILIFMLSLPDEWEFSIAGFDAILPHDGRDAITASLKRIEEAGYLRRDRERGANGQIGGVVWYVSDLPMADTPETDLPYTAEPCTDLPNTANPLQRKNLFDKEKRDKEKRDDAPLVLPFGPELCEVFGDWLAYKKERRQGYKAVGLRNLITQTQKAAEQFGEQAVADVIRTSMASGYQGIVFDRLKSGRPQQKGGATFMDLYLLEQEGGR